MDNTTYYYRAFVENEEGKLGRQRLNHSKPLILNSLSTLRRSSLWLDASDVDGDGQRDIADGSKVPLWIDKSRSSKDANNHY